MNGKQGRPAWTGIPPSPKVFEQLDQEEISVLALLAWSVASNRPVTALDVAALPDRHGSPLGRDEAKQITQTLADLGILSVLGMHNDRPLGIFVGGFQPLAALKAAQGRPGYSSSATGRPTFSSAPRPHRSHAGAPSTGPRPGTGPAGRPGSPTRPERRTVPDSKKEPPFPREWRIERDLGATSRTPDWVVEGARKLRDRQVKLEQGLTRMSPAKAAEERLDILSSRVRLYQSWLKAEPGHPTLRAVLKRKRRALPELRYQLERARMPGGSNREQKRKAEQQGSE